MFLRASLWIYNLWIPRIGMIFLALNLIKIATKWIMNRNSVIPIKSNTNVSKKHKLNLFLWAYGITVFSREFCFLKRFGTFYFSDFKQKHNNIIQHNWTFWHKHQNNRSLWVCNVCVFHTDFLCFKKNFLKVQSVPLKVESCH